MAKSAIPHQPHLDNVSGPNWHLIGQKMKIFNFELEEKLDKHFQVKFDGEFDGNSLEALN